MPLPRTMNLLFLKGPKQIAPWALLDPYGYQRKGLPARVSDSTHLQSKVQL